ncbi:MAG: DUF4345 family protein [Pirellulaceae bacterium]|nr:DUF4345 family protein [Pirellulaceae bacterium]
MSRGLLTVIAAAYLALAAWCAFAPEQTSASLGLSLRPGSGQSEFLTVYGGLQLGLGLYFLLPWVRPDSTGTVLLASVIVHGSLIAFRAVSLPLYGVKTSTTLVIAGLELAIFLASLVVWGLGSFSQPRAPR